MTTPPRLTARQVYKGNPATPGYEPDKDDIVRYHELIELQIALSGVAAYFEDTLANLNGVSSPPTGSTGFVLDDGVNTGVYLRGTSAWAKTAELPPGFDDLDAYTVSETDAAITAALTSALSQVYTKDQTYSKAQVDALVDGVVVDVAAFDAAVEAASEAAASAALAASLADDIAAFGGFRDFADLATFKADTTLTYTGGLDGTVAAGAIIRLRQEGVSLIVVASGASDADHQNSNGTPVKVKVLGFGGANGIVVTAEQFGAAGNYVNDASPGTDDSNAIDAALAFLAAKGGGTLFLPARYRVTSPIVFPDTGIEIVGAYPEGRASLTTSVFSRGVVVGDFDAGPVIYMGKSECAVRGLTVEATATRAAATITTGVGNINCGIQIEAADSPSAEVQNIVLESVLVKRQPADGIAVEGGAAVLRFLDTHVIGCGRHGRSFTSGQLSGRTNVGRPGLIIVDGGRTFDNGGHNVLIGHPDDGNLVPLRVMLQNHESYRGGLDAGERLYPTCDVVIGENVVLNQCATAGTTTGNTPDKPAVTIGGRNVSLRDCRYLNSTTNYVQIIQFAALTTIDVMIDGGKADTVSGSPSEFASIAGGADGITIRGVTHDCNPINAIAVASTNNNIILSDTVENKTLYHNHTFDFTGASAVGIDNPNTNLRIASGVVTVTKPGMYSILNESSAASDDLVTINGGVAGMMIILRQGNGSEVPRLMHATGNLRLHGGANYTFPSQNALVSLVYTGSVWLCVAPPGVV